jgi:hypothetical protein
MKPPPANSLRGGARSMQSCGSSHVEGEAQVAARRHLEAQGVVFRRFLVDLQEAGLQLVRRDGRRGQGEQRQQEQQTPHRSDAPASSVKSRMIS